MEEAGRHLNKVFCEQQDLQDWQDKLEDTVQKDETLQIFSKRISRLVRKSFPTADGQTTSSLEMKYFLSGIQTDTAIKIKARKPKNLKEALNKAIIYEKDRKKSLSIDKKNCKDKTEPKLQINYLLGETLKVPNLLKEEEDAETTNSLIKISKRHGGQREVTLLTMIEELKNSNTSKNSRLKSSNKRTRETST